MKESVNSQIKIQDAIPITETVATFEDTENGKNIKKYKSAKEAIEVLKTY